MKCNSLFLCFALLLLQATSTPAIEFVRIGEMYPIDPRISDDGQFAAGQRTTDVLPVRWSRPTGMENLGTLLGMDRGAAFDISGDGTVVVGASAGGDIELDTYQAEAFRWTTETGMVGLGVPPGFRQSIARAISQDKSTIVGHAENYPIDSQAFRWTAQQGLTVLGFPTGASGAQAVDVSANGQVIAISAFQYDPQGEIILDSQRAAIWTQEDGFLDLGPLPQGWQDSYSRQITIDGSILLGSGFPGGGGNRAFLWTRQQGYSPLPILDGSLGWSFLPFMTPDASMVFTGCRFDDTLESITPLIWDREHGTREVKQVLRDEHGFTEPFRYPRAISADAKTLLIQRPDEAGNEELWVLQLDKPLVDPGRIPTWNVDAGGNWSAAASWTTSVPNAKGANAILAGIITAPRTVTLDVPVTLRRLDFDDANAYTVSGANTLTLEAGSGDTLINVKSGSHTISAPVTLVDDTTVTITPAASNLSLTGTLTATGRTLTKAGAGTLTVNNVRAQALSIGDGTVAIAPNGAAGGVSALGALAIAGANDAWTARYDLADNDAVVQSSLFAKATDIGRLQNQLKQGFNNGTWQGLGITSSAAAANPAADTGLAIVDNGLLGYTDFSGQPVTADSILLKYTYYGDIDQNGQVDADDLTVFASNFGRATGATQIDGDIDFNGAVNADDLTVFANNFNKGIGNPLAAASVQAVPEPATWILAALAVASVVITLRVTKHHSSRGRWT
jgi:hypothetical protein